MDSILCSEYQDRGEGTAGVSALRVLSLILAATLLAGVADAWAQSSPAAPSTSCSSSPTSCGPNSTAPLSPNPEVNGRMPPLKGMELYSWQAADRWQYVLTFGSNRLKGDREIKEGKVMTNLEDLKRALMALPGQTEIFWELKQGVFELPPAAVVRDVQQEAAAHGCRVTLLKPR
jgi:hypothetical protein